MIISTNLSLNKCTTTQFYEVFLPKRYANVSGFAQLLYFLKSYKSDKNLLAFKSRSKNNDQDKKHMNYNNHEFVSEFGYTIVLPENWAEYEDEKNTNAFFDTTEWTGNLRISPIQIDPKKGNELLEYEMSSFEGQAEKFKTQNGFEGIKYSDEDDENFITYWFLIMNDKMFICSFTINITEKETNKNKMELIKVNKIIDSLRPK